MFASTSGQPVRPSRQRSKAAASRRQGAPPRPLPAVPCRWKMRLPCLSANSLQGWVGGGGGDGLVDWLMCTRTLALAAWHTQPPPPLRPHAPPPNAPKVVPPQQLKDDPIGGFCCAALPLVPRNLRVHLAGGVAAVRQPGRKPAAARVCGVGWCGCVGGGEPPPQHRPDPLHTHTTQHSHHPHNPPTQHNTHTTPTTHPPTHSLGGVVPPQHAIAGVKVGGH